MRHAHARAPPRTGTKKRGRAAGGGSLHARAPPRTVPKTPRTARPSAPAGRAALLPAGAAAGARQGRRGVHHGQGAAACASCTPVRAFRRRRVYLRGLTGQGRSAGYQRPAHGGAGGLCQARRVSFACACARLRVLVRNINQAGGLNRKFAPRKQPCILFGVHPSFCSRPLYLFARAPAGNSHKYQSSAGVSAGARVLSCAHSRPQIRHGFRRGRWGEYFCRLAFLVHRCNPLMRHQLPAWLARAQ